MGFVEVDLSMVPRPVASGPASATRDHNGDPTFASVDFGSVRHYRVEVTTAAIRGAGTSGSVEVTFIGDQGVSPPIPLEYVEGDSPGFERGTTLPFRVTSYMDPGRLSQVQVRLIPEMSQVGHGWLLEHVRVTCEETWFGDALQQPQVVRRERLRRQGRAALTAHGRGRVPQAQARRRDAR
jgi:protein phosphatase PTC7